MTFDTKQILDYEIGKLEKSGKISEEDEDLAEQAQALPSNFK